MKSSIYLSASIIFLFQSLSLAQNVSSSACAPLHIIVARASTEPQGEGIIGAVAQAVQQEISGVTSYAVVYPATLGNYLTSESKGTAGMTADIEGYVTSCPSSKIVLLGYSQGAQVVGDTLCGTSEVGFKQTPPLASEYGSKIVAAIQMGDPSYVPGLPWDVGTAETGGIFPRVNTSACDPFSTRIQSYCSHNDEYCDSGDSLLVHLSYLSKYQTAAVSFIVGQYKNATGSTNGTSSSSTTGTTSSTKVASGTSSVMQTTGTASSGSAVSSGTASTDSGTATSLTTGTASAAAPTSTAGSDQAFGKLGAESWIVAALFALIF